MKILKVAFLTSGGIAPCLTSSIGSLIKEYSKHSTSIEFIGYRYGYKGLLLGQSIKLPGNIENINNFHSFGGTILGNSRVKLTNTEDCISKGYISKNQTALEVAAKQLINDKVDVLHTIGGDDTNSTANDLVNFLKENNYDLTVVGLPKTIDNDVFPIEQTLGAWTAAEESARFFTNIVNENTTSSRHLIIHEVMGRNCGWLAAESSRIYLKSLDDRIFLDNYNLSKVSWSIDSVLIPEISIDIEEESERLLRVMDRKDSVNIFLSEGAGIESIIKDKELKGEDVPRDAFGHPHIDEINPGSWFANHLKDTLKADKVLIQKSGYFARSAKPNSLDCKLIYDTARVAVDCSMNKKSGVVGMDQDRDGVLSCIDFNRIKGGKEFDYKVDWFSDILDMIGQK